MSDQNFSESAERLNKTIHDIKTEQKADRESLVKGTAKFDKAVEELRENQKRFELAQKASRSEPNIGADERALMKYIEVDEERIRSSGGVNNVHTKGRRAHSRADGVSNGAVRMRYVEYADGTYDKGLLDDDPCCEWQAELQQLVDTRNWVRAMQSNPSTPQCNRQIEQHLRSAPAPIRKLFSDSVSNTADNLIPDVTLPRLEMELRAARRVEALFQTVASPNSGTITLPFLSTGLRLYKAGAPAGDDPAQYTASTVVTAARTHTIKKTAVRAQLDEDALEDTIIASMPMMRAEIVSAIADGWEDIIINGDTGTHQDTSLGSWDPRSRWGSSGLGGTGDHRRVDIGLRARAFDVSNTNDGSGSKTAAGALAALGSLDSPHAFGRTVFIVSPEYLVENMLGFDEVETVDKLGPTATIVTGQLASLYGRPVVMTEFLTNDLKDTGLFTDTDGTTTGYLVVNTDRFLMGSRRATSVELAKDITRGIFNLVATRRATFFSFDSSSKKNVRFEFKL